MYVCMYVCVCVCVCVIFLRCAIVCVRASCLSKHIHVCLCAHTLKTLRIPAPPKSRLLYQTMSRPGTRSDIQSSASVPGTNLDQATSTANVSSDGFLNFMTESGLAEGLAGGGRQLPALGMMSSPSNSSPGGPLSVLGPRTSKPSILSGGAHPRPSSYTSMVAPSPDPTISALTPGSTGGGKRGGRAAGRKSRGPGRKRSVDDEDYEDDAYEEGRSTKSSKRGKGTTAVGDSGGAGGGGGDRSSKGLRHFSVKVCEKVQQKGRTTYNEVADELVAEFSNSKNPNGDKNIRRRVYDALNVLMAMDIIVKQAREIKWKGLPSSFHQEHDQLEKSKSLTEERIKKKKEKLTELRQQHDSLRRLHDRNSRALSRNSELDESVQIQLPFILITTKKHTEIECNMTKERNEISFNFSEPFQIVDDHEILRRMGVCGVLDAELADMFLPSYSAASTVAADTSSTTAAATVEPLRPPPPPPLLQETKKEEGEEEGQKGLDDGVGGGGWRQESAVVVSQVLTPPTQASPNKASPTLVASQPLNRLSPARHRSPSPMKLPHSPLLGPCSPSHLNQQCPNSPPLPHTMPPPSPPIHGHFHHNPVTGSSSSPCPSSSSSPLALHTPPPRLTSSPSPSTSSCISSPSLTTTAHSNPHHSSPSSS